MQDMWDLWRKNLHKPQRCQATWLHSDPKRVTETSKGRNQSIWSFIWIRPSCESGRRWWVKCSTWAARSPRWRLKSHVLAGASMRENIRHTSWLRRSPKMWPLPRGGSRLVWVLLPLLNMLIWLLLGLCSYIKLNFKANGTIYQRTWLRSYHSSKQSRERLLDLWWPKSRRRWWCLRVFKPWWLKGNPNSIVVLPRVWPWHMLKLHA